MSEQCKEWKPMAMKALCENCQKRIWQHTPEVISAAEMKADPKDPFWFEQPSVPPPASPALLEMTNGKETRVVHGRENEGLVALRVCAPEPQGRDDRDQAAPADNSQVPRVQGDKVVASPAPTVDEAKHELDQAIDGALAGHEDPALIEPRIQALIQAAEARGRAPQEEAIRESPVCPQCRGPLELVRQGPNSILNSDQFDSVKAGDYFCKACPGSEAHGTTYKYWWKRNLDRLP